MSDEEESGLLAVPVKHRNKKVVMLRTANSIQDAEDSGESQSRDHVYGETISPPAGLKDDWSYISDKNANKRAEHATSNIDTLIHLLKGNIGTGLLALPYAVSEAGFILGPIGILVFGMIATHCMVLLVDCARKLCRENNITSLDYAETMQFAVIKNFKPRFGKIAKVIVNVFLVITQFGFCSVYFVFIATTLYEVIRDMYCIEIDFRLWVLIILIPVILFSWIRNLDNLASLSMLANVCIFVGLIIIFYDEIDKLAIKGVHEAAIKEGRLTKAGSLLSLAMFFGTSVFAYEAIGVILPLENKMKQPEKAKNVIYTAMAIITVLYAVFGLVGYLVYGKNVSGSVTLSLCGTNAVTAIVFAITKLLFAINIFVSYLIQFYVPMDFLEPHVYRLFKTNFMNYKYPKQGERIKLLIQLGFRTLLVVITAIFAVSIPNIENLITLVGAGASSCLAFIFPPLIEIMVYRSERSRKLLWVLPWPVWIAKDVAIIILGVTGFIFGSFAAMYNIFKSSGGSDSGCSDITGTFQTHCNLGYP